MSYWLQVVVAAPAHSSIAGPLTYQSESPLAVGSLVRVPLGRREVLGVVWELLADSGTLLEMQTRHVAGVLEGLPPLSATWRKLVQFTAAYYQRSLGEVALAALPPQLRDLSNVQLARRLKRPMADTRGEQAGGRSLVLSAQQAAVLAEFDADTRPALLFGATGSGKTEVYLRAAARVLALDPAAQVLVMVPEINLTPQLQSRFEARFAHLGKERVVALHSGLTPAQRLKSWLAAHAGHARLVLGTRMAVFASMPNLRLIVVDEEHDPSYKQQEGARYSARDLAIYRAKIETEDATHEHGPCRVLLGSATPSLESWQATLAGRYQRLVMDERIGTGTTPSTGEEVAPYSAGPQAEPYIPPKTGEPAPSGDAGSLPTVRRVDMNHQPKHCIIAPPLLDAIAQRVARGEQSLIFLNRRGYAPVLACHDCGWKSECPHCSAFRVFHKIDRTLRCHHCGFTERVPRACPSCGNIDIAPVGRGTERLEEHLAELLAGVKRPDGEPVRIARIDADSTRLKGALESQLASVHAGEVDVLVGTQMIAKGHDFRHITLVAAINPDGALFSSDFRAPERLFSLLMQAGGRAGRDARHSGASEMWVQTFHPEHPLFAALKQHDYAGFATQQLAEREAAGMSPFGFSALVRAEARTQEVAQGFLNAAAAQAEALELTGNGQVTAYPAVPMTIQRVANIERAQMLVESPSRAALQRFLAAWQPVLFETRQQAEFKSLIRWAIDVDPIAI
ncbi:primosomal protein N' [Polaromonas sp. JS666]|uniref:replication restart helicase PriA n=1 Tax=Polaromonas sp. (strain JS666 / ATCC BAA-500) TaxID=296591 RepID=UPI0008836869|nr:primosomal protein N' [Polaromonas sp. JS666]SDO07365.1 replication restart DNA helicase PriA [Polaromonas sp. JS666]